MDIFAHGLWTGAAARRVNQGSRKNPPAPRVPLWQAVFWGVIPDLLAFTPLFLWLFWGLASGHPHFAEIPRHDSFSVNEGPWMVQFTHIFYSFTHSLITLAVTAGALYFVRRVLLHRTGLGPIWAMGGWLFHILLDIPTHTYRFYATPFLWPLSDYRSPGVINWDAPWFMLANYTAIVIVYVYLWRRDKRLRK